MSEDNLKKEEARMAALAAGGGYKPASKKVVTVAAGDSQNKCAICHKTVYPTEKISANQLVFHKACFTCSHCKRTLKMDDFMMADSNHFDGHLWCKSDYKKLVDLAGGDAKKILEASAKDKELRASSTNLAAIASSTSHDNIAEQAGGHQIVPSTSSSAISAAADIDDDAQPAPGSYEYYQMKKYGLLKPEKKKEEPAPAAAPAAAPAVTHAAEPTPAAKEEAVATPVAKEEAVATPAAKEEEAPAPAPTATTSTTEELKPAESTYVEPEQSKPAPAPVAATTTPAANAPKLEGNTWIVEKMDNTTVEVTPESKHIVYIGNCKGTMVIVKGKVKSVQMSNCTKSGVIVDTCIATLELTNCKSVKSQINGCVPSIQVDNTQGATIYLPATSLEVEVFTCKSTEVNLNVMEGEDYKETAIPSQFITKEVNSKWVTEPVVHVGV